jgi:hypothetical protein
MQNIDTSALATEGRVKAILCFNKANGKWINTIGWVDPETLSGKEYMVFVEDEFDMVNDRVMGEYPHYTIVDRNEGPQPFYEAQLDAAMSQKITKLYPVVQQVNILGRALQLIAEKTGVELPELAEMLSYIDLCKDVNANSKEFYRESPDYVYISNEQLAAEENARYEGGLHEALGPRQITGGSVF